MKKLTQSIIFILVIAALVIGLIACAQKNNEYTALTAKEFANLLLEEGGFTASLSEVDSSLMQQLYALDPDLFDEKVIFASTGNSAEEIILLHVKDSASRDAVRDALESHLANQIAILADYLPDEIPKLESAKVQQNDDYFAIVVSADNAIAQSMTEDWLASR